MTRKQLKARANRLVRLAVKAGELTRPSLCSVCSRKAKVAGHHADYDKPLEVEWLCAKCHAARHRDRPKAKYSGGEYRALPITRRKD